MHHVKTAVACLWSDCDVNSEQFYITAAPVCKMIIVWFKQLRRQSMILEVPLFYVSRNFRDLVSNFNVAEAMKHKTWNF